MWETEFELSMLKERKVIINCPNGDLVEELMDLLAKSGVRWGFGGIPSVHNSVWMSKRTCYWIKDGVLSYGTKGYAEDHADKYQDFIKCTFCGLISEPDFEISNADFEAIISAGGGS